MLDILEKMEKVLPYMEKHPFFIEGVIGLSILYKFLDFYKKGNYNLLNKIKRKRLKLNNEQHYRIKRNMETLRKEIEAERITLIRIIPTFEDGKRPYEDYEVDIVSFVSKLENAGLETQINVCDINHEKDFILDLIHSISQSVRNKKIINVGEREYAKALIETYNLKNMTLFSIMNENDKVSFILLIEKEEDLSNLEIAKISKISQNIKVLIKY